MATTSRRPNQGLLNYEKFLAVLRDELDRSLKPLADDLKDVKAAQANTYNREMMDGKLQVIVDQLKDHEEDLKGIHNLIGNSGRELIERIAAIAGIAYALVYVIPHFFH